MKFPWKPGQIKIRSSLAGLMLGRGAAVRKRIFSAALTCRADNRMFGFMMWENELFKDSYTSRDRWLITPSMASPWPACRDAGVMMSVSDVPGPEIHCSKWGAVSAWHRGAFYPCGLVVSYSYLRLMQLPFIVSFFFPSRPQISLCSRLGCTDTTFLQTEYKYFILILADLSSTGMSTN